MKYSLELLETNKIFIQETKQRIKHGVKGKVLLNNCTLKAAKQIQFENN